MTENTEICRINADGTTTYHWDNIEEAATRWQPGCDLSVYVSKLLLPLRPSREWVGLTDEEWQQIQRDHFRPDQHKAIEAKLKEKNS
ncbi:MAG: hypothetical protein EHM17_17380 [Verrucomicrobiaceae bacterium]|nr:MAG: hypothetical protein EHM17_17380 [Verrucomicrobiaceae bacterium]